MPMGIAMTAESRNATQTRAFEIPASTSRPLSMIIVHRAEKTAKGDGRNIGEIQPRGAAADHIASTRSAVPMPAVSLTLRGNAPRKTNNRARGGMRPGFAGIVFVTLISDRFAKWLTRRWGRSTAPRPDDGSPRHFPG